MTRSVEESKRTWFIDSGAFQHVCCVRGFFHDYKELATPEIVRLADSTAISGIGIGSVIWQDTHFNKTTTIRNVLFVLDLSQNLISVKTIIQAEYKVEFLGSTCKISSQDSSDVIAQGRIAQEGNLYQLDCNVISNSAHASIA